MDVVTGDTGEVLLPEGLDVVLPELGVGEVGYGGIGPVPEEVGAVPVADVEFEAVTGDAGEVLLSEDELGAGTPVLSEEEYGYGGYEYGYGTSLVEDETTSVPLEVVPVDGAEEVAFEAVTGDMGEVLELDDDGTLELTPELYESDELDVE